MIKLILFDLGGVLFTDGTSKFIKSVSTRYNIPLEKVFEIVNGELGLKYREAQITRDEFWNQLVSKLSLTENIIDLENEWISYYELFEKTKEIIIKLKEKYKVYYLSNNVKERAERLNEKFDYLKLFDGGVYSHEVKAIKPDPKIYGFALNKAGFSANETVFIDDKESSLEPAKKMGIETILFENSDKLEADLIKLGVL
jgi:putative hydrolase of the HAD superfamily